jgi:hypothetical protein
MTGYETKGLVDSDEVCQRSFDPLASVDAMARDISLYNDVLPETRQQIENEELSYLAEGVNMAARPEFVFKRDGDEFVYFDDGKWRRYGDMIETGLRVARNEARRDPRRWFLVESAQTDYYNYYQMRKLKPGEKYTWIAAYPDDQEERWGAEFLEKRCGLFPKRKMGFINQAFCGPDNSIVMQSQIIDRANETEALFNVETASKNDPSADLNKLVAIFDTELTKKYGGYFYTGRRDAKPKEDAWQQILTHQDLIKYLMDGLESIARSELPREQLEVITKRHKYGTWALFKKRLDGTSWTLKSSNGGVENQIAPEELLARQVREAFSDFASRGEVLIGCGGSIVIISGEAAIMDADSEDVLAAIFKSKAPGDCKFTSKECPKCHKKDIRTEARRGKYYGECGCVS